MLITENEIIIKSGDTYEEVILPEGDRPWVGGINGTFYSISRGKPVKVPSNLAALIRQNERLTVLAVESVTEYKKPEGKNLGGKKK